MMEERDPWTAHMLRGDFEQAWRVSDEVVSAGTHIPVWRGETFQDKRVLIRCVHGLGDTIQFIRYAASLRNAGATKVSAQMHPPLVPLLRSVPDLDEAFTWDGTTEYDVDLEVMELPWIFRTTIETIPQGVPYISAPCCPTRCADRIGVVWSSSTWDESRSIPIRRFELLKEFDLISFQHGPDHVHARLLPWLDYSGEQTSDLVRTAAEVQALRLLITPDTMLAHMAGALGVKVWVLLKHDADWRWMTHRGDSPWYPTMRLFRQSEPGNWESAMRQVHCALKNDDY